MTNHDCNAIVDYEICLALAIFWLGLSRWCLGARGALATCAVVGLLVAEDQESLNLSDVSVQEKNLNARSYSCAQYFVEVATCCICIRNGIA